jgi:hypothetical protein
LANQGIQIQALVRFMSAEQKAVTEAIKQQHALFQVPALFSCWRAEMRHPPALEVLVCLSSRLLFRFSGASKLIILWNVVRVVVVAAESGPPARCV